MMEHLIVAPIVLPLAMGAALLLVDERRHRAKAIVSLCATVALVTLAMLLVARADTPATHVYRLGSWPAPFGIVLVADRLSAAMVLLAAVLAVAALWFSLARWHRAGPHFHTLVQFLLAGLWIGHHRIIKPFVKGSRGGTASFTEQTQIMIGKPTADNQHAFIAQRRQCAAKRKVQRRIIVVVDRHL